MSQDNADKAAALPEPAADETIVESTPEPAAPAGEATPQSEPESAPNEYEAVFVPAGSVIVAGPSLLAKLGAEAFGTFLLVLAGLGVALYLGVSGVSSALAVGLAFGLAVLAGAVAVGHVSGGHFNPAVTVGAAIAGRTAWKDVLPYWLAQLFGATAAAAVLFTTIPDKLPSLLAQGAEATKQSFFSGVANGYEEHSPLAVASQGQVSFTLVSALLIEIVVTALFVGVILGATDRRATSVSAPLAIGLALAVLILVAIPITNASLNPARSFAAAVFSESWAWKQLWLFVVAPIVGAALSGLVYRAFAAEPVQDNLLEEDEEFVTTEDTLVVTER
ncbi:MIP family channel protein [Cellulomonas sp. URHE0023]|uniref:MIP family channel protein n=1 Tax=Cellulomonas sp. URHE0023 TaxID=1380354 RepID=UPI000483A12E|nr:MIP family channel protein [Cellulomonas sp. URHE0023]